MVASALAVPTEQWDQQLSSLHLQAGLKNSIAWANGLRSLDKASDP